jgi:hypothetical protein
MDSMCVVRRPGCAPAAPLRAVATDATRARGGGKAGRVGEINIKALSDHGRHDRQPWKIVALEGTKTASNAIFKRGLDSASTQLELVKEGALLVNGAVRLRALS